MSHRVQGTGGAWTNSAELHYRPTQRLCHNRDGIECQNPRSYTISGLTPGTEYEVAVLARNANGWGYDPSTGQSAAVKLVSNTGQTDATAANFTNDYSREFFVANYTGGGIGSFGFKLTRVDLELQHSSGAQPAYTVSVYADSPSQTGRPGDLVGTLTNPPVLPTSFETVQFTAPGDGIDLSLNTKYHLVIDVSSGTASTELKTTASNAEDSGGTAGWGIGDIYRSRTSSSAGARTAHASDSLQLAVYGYGKAAFKSATIADKHVTVNLNGPRGGCPNVGAWTIKVDGDSYSPTSQYCKANSVEIWLSALAPKANFGQTVTVSYDKDRAAYSRVVITFTKLLTPGGAEVDSFTDQPVTNLAPPPWTATAANGRKLTFVFQEQLDDSSVPSGSAFQVIATHSGMPGSPNCAVGCRFGASAVSFSDAPVVSGTGGRWIYGTGTMVTLTLPQVNPHGASATLAYTPPSANPLRWPGGKAVGSFQSAVTIQTPKEKPALRAGELTYSADTGKSYLWLHFDQKLDANSLPAGSAFTVTARPSGGGTRTVAGTGTAQYDASLLAMGGVVVDGSLVVVELAETVAVGLPVTVSYVKPSANPLRDRGDQLVESFSNVPLNNGQTRITSVALSSDPGRDRTYGQGDKIEVPMTFTDP